MSHTSRFKLGIHDLELLKQMCDRLGLVFHEGVTQHQVYARKDPCLHMISRANSKPGDYEIGVVRTEDGKGYDLNWDPYSHGQGVKDMHRMLGNNLGVVGKEYLHQAAINMAEQYGGVVHYEENTDELAYTVELPEEVVINA